MNREEETVICYDGNPFPFDATTSDHGDITDVIADFCGNLTLKGPGMYYPFNSPEGELYGVLLEVEGFDDEDVDGCTGLMEAIANECGGDDGQDMTHFKGGQTSDLASFVSASIHCDNEECTNPI